MKSSSILVPVWWNWIGYRWLVVQTTAVWTTEDSITSRAFFFWFRDICQDLGVFCSCSWLLRSSHAIFHALPLFLIFFHTTYTHRGRSRGRVIPNIVLQHTQKEQKPNKGQHRNGSALETGLAEPSERHMKRWRWRRWWWRRRHYRAMWPRKRISRMSAECWATFPVPRVRSIVFVHLGAGSGSVHRIPNERLVVHSMGQCGHRRRGCCRRRDWWPGSAASGAGIAHGREPLQKMFGHSVRRFPAN